MEFTLIHHDIRIVCVELMVNSSHMHHYVDVSFWWSPLFYGELLSWWFQDGSDVAIKVPSFELLSSGLKSQIYFLSENILLNSC